MTNEEAHKIANDYQKTHTVPSGFEVDSSFHDTVSGSKYEIVQVSRDNATVISFVIKNDHVEEVTVV
jgi:hypothetical protein